MKRLVFVVLMMLVSTTASAISSYLTQFNTRYGTSATPLNSCIICHQTASGSPSSPRNSYGVAFDTPSNAHNFPAIEQLDSDGDGFTNIVEITARTFPGNASSFPAPVIKIPRAPTNLGVTQQ